jgi:hypothetical protein
MRGSVRGVTYSVQLSPNAIDFGSLAGGTVSAVRTVQSTNTGTGRLNIDGQIVTGPFQASYSCGTYLDPGASCTASVTFNPVGVGPSGGLVEVHFIEIAPWQFTSVQGTGT